MQGNAVCVVRSPKGDWRRAPRALSRERSATCQKRGSPKKQQARHRPKPPSSIRCRAPPSPEQPACWQPTGRVRLQYRIPLAVPSIFSPATSSSAFHEDRRCPKEISVGCSPRAACCCAPAAGRRYSSVVVAIAASAIARLRARARRAARDSVKPGSAISSHVADVICMLCVRGVTAPNAN